MSGHSFRVSSIILKQRSASATQAVVLLHKQPLWNFAFQWHRFCHFTSDHFQVGDWAGLLQTVFFSWKRSCSMTISSGYLFNLFTPTPTAPSSEEAPPAPLTQDWLSWCRSAWHGSCSVLFVRFQLGWWSKIGSPIIFKLKLPTSFNDFLPRRTGQMTLCHQWWPVPTIWSCQSEPCRNPISWTYHIRKQTGSSSAAFCIFLLFYFLASLWLVFFLSNVQTDTQEQWFQLGSSPQMHEASQFKACRFCQESPEVGQFQEFQHATLRETSKCQVQQLWDPQAEVGPGNARGVGAKVVDCPLCIVSLQTYAEAFAVSFLHCLCDRGNVLSSFRSVPNSRCGPTTVVPLSPVSHFVVLDSLDLNNFWIDLTIFDTFGRKIWNGPALHDQPQPSQLGGQIARRESRFELLAMRR